MAAHAFSEAERGASLRLARTPQVGPVTYANLMARFGSAELALEALPHLARRGGAKAVPAVPAAAEAERELATIRKLGGRLIICGESDYPPGLAALEAPPPVLTVLGRADLLQVEIVAMVGARNASALGRKLASMMAAELGAAGLVVASGMARGIDTAAHEGALASGTIAVLAGGADLVYPPENQTLYDRLRREGAVVSEMPPGQAPQARHFPRRNRVISGLARGVVVVEAAESSGSLITANYALEQGREIFAVPGSPLDPRAKGTNRLIREGATLTENAGDVLAVLRPILGHSFAEPDSPSLPASQNRIEAEADEIRREIEELLGPAPVETDELVRQTGASPAAIITVLLELELSGRLTRHPGNRVSQAQT